jgi:hypothetical protein
MIHRLLLRIDNRFVSSKERGEIETYLGTVRERRAALDEIRERAVPLVDDLMTAIRRLYPEFSKHRPQGYDKGHRDMVLLTQIAANAMFLSDTDSYDEMFTYWYRSILKSVHVSPQFLADTFALWRECLRRHLTAETFMLLAPYANHFATVLSDVPDPSKDETGRRMTNV